MNYTVEVLPPKIGIRKKPNGDIVDYLYQGDLVRIDQRKDLADGSTWYHMYYGQGWIDKQYLKIVSNNESTSSVVPTDTTDPIDPDTIDTDTTSTSEGLDANIIQMLYDSMQKNAKKITPSTRLFGSPHQFIKSADFRLGTAEYDLGRKYSEAIVSEAPIVYLLPGKPSYLPDLSSEQRKGLDSFIKSSQLDSKSGKGVIDKIVGSEDIRYFSFLSDYATYMRYVNLLCRICAVYMDIGDETAPNSTTKLKHYDWSNYRYDSAFKQKTSEEDDVFDLSDLKTDMYEALFGNYQYVQFYVEPNTSFNESSSNSTQQSKLESIFDGAEGIIKELSFLTESMALKNVDEARGSFASGIDAIADKMKISSKENFFSRLLGMSSQVLSGSNIVFPQLWGEAAYNKSYNITVNLVSPYGDKKSIYFNIIVPMMHILAMSLPRQTTANSYAAPFLVRAFSKGWFSCEMGIIDSLSIDKGNNGAWSVNGLPTEVKMNISIKDLYSNLMITPNSRPDLFVENRGLVEFLAITCGLDITKPQFATQLDAIFSVLFLDPMQDIPSNMYRDFVQGIQNSLKSLFILNK